MAPYPELQLAVRECKDGDEGMNMVFVSYSDFRALAGSAAGQQDSVRVILEVRFSVWQPTLQVHACPQARVVA
jgi:hypothetical protein